MRRSDRTAQPTAKNGGVLARRSTSHRGRQGAHALLSRERRIGVAGANDDALAEAFNAKIIDVCHLLRRLAFALGMSRFTGMRYGHMGVYRRRRAVEDVTFHECHAHTADHTAGA